MGDGYCRSIEAKRSNEEAMIGESVYKRHVPSFRGNGEKGEGSTGKETAEDKE